MTNPGNNGKTVRDIHQELKRMIEIITGLEPDLIENDAGLFSLGIDSLMLVQLRKKINEKYNVDITVNDFFTNYTTVDKISQYLVVQIPKAKPLPGTAGKSVPSRPGLFNSPVREFDNINFSPGNGSTAGIIANQLEIMKDHYLLMTGIMEKQLMVLKGWSAPGNRGPVQGEALPKTGENDRDGSLKQGHRNEFHFMKKTSDDLNTDQEAFVKQFIEGYTAKTQGSKTFARMHREVLTDWVSPVNFRLSLKELNYAIVCQRAEGARFWDIDGNEYLDIAMGYAANYFGHNPPFVMAALEKQLEQGYEMGPMTVLTGEVAQLISRLALVERVVLSNTGTEAIMAALRIARTVTGRNKIVRFAGAYNGSFDGVLAEADEYGTFPMSPGTPQGMVEDIIVLPYGSPESLDIIEGLGEVLAGVLVEPIQGRKLSLQPRDFLHRLREITSRFDAALIFDDVYLGVHLHQGGSQAYFNIEADIVTFGKALGGGMPIGVVAGKAKFMDAIDGGYWDYGDSSAPVVQTTFYGGTFCRHPLGLAAAHAVLKYMEEQGPGLQEKVNQKVQYFAREVNDFCKTEQVPIRVTYAGASFRFDSFGKYHPSLLPLEIELFYHLLMDKGIYTLERKVCCLSIAHTDEDIQIMIKAVKDSISELRSGGFTFSETDHQDVGDNRQKDYPVTPAQQWYYVSSQVKDFEKVVHLPLAMTIKGRLDIKKMKLAMQEIANSLEMFQVGFEMKDSEIRQRIYDTAVFTPIHKKISEDRLEESIEEFLQPFDLAKPPLIRMGLLELSPNHFLWIVDTNHIISDGVSGNILIQGIIRLYEGKALELASGEYQDYLHWWLNYQDSPSFKTHEQYWLEKFSGSLPQLDLPGDFPRPAKKSLAGSLVKCRIDKAATKDLKQLARTSNATLFTVMLTAYYILLHKLSGQEDIIVGIPVGVRDEKGFDTITGLLSNMLALRARPTKDKTFTTFLDELKTEWMQAYLHKEYPYEILVEKIEVKKDLSRNPLFEAMFDYENVKERVLKIEDLACELYYIDMKTSVYDLSVEISEHDDFLEIILYYCTSLFKKKTIETWLDYFRQVLQDIPGNPDISIKDILKGIKIKKKKEIPAKNKEKNETPRDHQSRVAVSEIEKKLIRIWEQQLNIQDVRINDDFFELGGRSLDTIRLVSRINSQLGVNISLSAIFAHPTVSELAAQLEKNPVSSPQVGILPAPLRPAYALSHEQLRYWLGVQVGVPGTGAPEVTGVEVTSGIITFEGDLDFNHLKQTIHLVTKRHDILRTTYGEQEGKPVQIIRDDMDIPVEYVDLSGDAPGQRQEKLSRCLFEEYNREFNLETGPLMRFFVYKTDPSHHVLFCNAPHISFDGFSFSIIMQDMAHFYNNLKPGADDDSASLPPVRRYVDYVEWNLKQLESGQLDRQANYWTRYLTQGIPVSQLPGDQHYHEGETEAEPAKVFRLIIKPEWISKLRETASRENTTLFVTMMAILKTWIALMANQTIITVGTVFSARTYPELEKIPGIMMKVLPVRVDLSGNPDFRQILSRTKQVVLETANNQNYPLELVAHNMRKVIDLNRDIFSIVFIGQEAIMGNLHFNGLKTDFSLLLEFISPGQQEEEAFIECDYDLAQDLIIEMFEEDNHVKLIIRYNRRKFSSNTIKEYFTQFKSIIEQFINFPDLHLSQLQSLIMAEIDELF
jgi:glutamate-1-semialdehyde aminotransferase/acyl carrier protein/NRPS condensation-like uncharacterized protein